MAKDDVVIGIRTKDETKKGLKKAEKSISAFSKNIGTLLSAGAGIAAVKSFAEATLSANVEMQKLNASLISVTGSQKAASKAMGWLKQFAKTTPFQLNQVTDAFIKMKALGLDASEESLRSYGNTASAMGKDLNQMIEAVADASTGEFERLKEFGIKSRSEGDNVSFTFQNVTTTVKKNAQAISGYLKSIGDEKFGGAMSEQMNTLGGQISNLEGAWKELLVSFGEAGAADAAADSIGIITKALEGLKNVIDSDAFTDFMNSDLLASLPGLQVIALARTAKQFDEVGDIKVFDDLDAPQGRGGNVLDTTVEDEKTAKEKEASALATQRSIAQQQIEDHRQMQRAMLIAANDEILAIQAEQGNAEILQQQEIDDRKSEQLQMLRAANAVQYDLDVEAKDKANKDKMASDKAMQDAGMQALSDLGSLMNSENKKAFEIGKVAAIAQTTINTYKAAQSAFASGAEISYPVGVAFAAAAVAAGLANVQQIASTQYGGGGGGSPSVPSASSTGGVASVQPVGQPQIGSAADTNALPGIVIEGNSLLAVMMEEQIIPALNEAVSRGVTLTIR